jgi:8-oxo-dGTP diphosphatase
MASPESGLLNLDNALQVACGLIVRNETLLAVQRNVGMQLPLKWEFPGGKLEPGESLESCLLRELREELCLDVRILKAFPPFISQLSGDRPLVLNPFLCDCGRQEPVLMEHAAFKWVSRENALSLDWAPADIPVLLYWMGK